MVVMGVIATAALSAVALVALVAVLSPQQVAHRARRARRSLSAAAMQSSDLISHTWLGRRGSCLAAECLVRCDGHRGMRACQEV
jgi:hypothetical protein